MWTLANILFKNLEYINISKKSGGSDFEGLEVWKTNLTAKESQNTWKKIFIKTWLQLLSMLLNESSYKTIHCSWIKSRGMFVVLFTTMEGTAVSHQTFAKFSLYPLFKSWNIGLKRQANIRVFNSPDLGDRHAIDYSWHHH